MEGAVGLMSKVTHPTLRGCFMVLLPLGKWREISV